MNQDYDKPYEIFIVDNCSTENAFVTEKPTTH